MRFRFVTILNTIYIKKTVFNLEAIVFSISSIQKVVQFSKSNPTNYLEESRDVAMLQSNITALVSKITENHLVKVFRYLSSLNWREYLLLPDGRLCDLSREEGIFVSSSTEESHHSIHLV